MFCELVYIRTIADSNSLNLVPRRIIRPISECYVRINYDV